MNLTLEQLLESLVSGLYLHVPGPEIDRVRQFIVKVLVVENPGTSDDMIIAIYNMGQTLSFTAPLVEGQAGCDDDTFVVPSPDMIYSEVLTLVDEYFVDNPERIESTMLVDVPRQFPGIALGLSAGHYLKNKRKIEKRPGMICLQLLICAKDITNRRRIMSAALWRACQGTRPVL